MEAMSRGNGPHCFLQTPDTMTTVHSGLSIRGLIQCTNDDEEHPHGIFQ